MSRNVFLDLGFAEDEATERALRVEIALRVELLIRDRRLTQKEAARLFGVPQPTISKIVNGKLANLSLGFLIRMLVRAGLPFSIRRGSHAEDIEVSIGDRGATSATRRDEIVVAADTARTPGVDIRSFGTSPVTSEAMFDVAAGRRI